MYAHILKRYSRDIFLIFVFFQTPLHWASYKGKGDVVEILLRNGANIHEKDVKLTEMKCEENERQLGDNLCVSEERERERIWVFWREWI